MCHVESDAVMYNANRQNTIGLSHNHRVQEIMFPNNQALFWNENIAWAKALRDMEMDFGIIRLRSWTRNRTGTTTSPRAVTSA